MSRRAPPRRLVHPSPSPRLPLVALPGLSLALSLSLGCEPQTGPPAFGTPGENFNPTTQPSPTPGLPTPTPTATPTPTPTPEGQTPSATATGATPTATESGTPGSADGSGTVVISQTLPGDVSVTSTLGSLELNALGVSSGATITYRYSAPTLGASDLARLTVSTAISGGTLSVEPVIPQDLTSAVVDLSLGVSVPESQTFSVQTEGATTLLGLSAGGSIVSGAGPVLGIALDGTLDIQSEGGGVDIQTALSAAERVTIAATDDGIILRIPAGVGAAVNAETADGVVTFTGITFSGNNFEGYAAGTVGLGSAVISLYTGSGDIAIIGE